MTRSMIDSLESRQMLAANLLRVGTVTADNRGEVIIRFSEAATGVRGGAGQMYTAGADGKLFTSDDKKENPRVTYSTNKKQMTIRGNLPPNTPYRIKLDGKTRIRSAATGQLLDGDFVSATRASGNGKAGGNFEFSTSRNTSKTPTAVMHTTLGDLVLRLRKDKAPLTVANFMAYADASRWDYTFVARSEPTPTPFVIQAGSLRIDNDGLDPTDIVKVAQFDEIDDEAPGAIPNTRGTIAFARGSGDDATNQWFINLKDNSQSLDDGFTVFAELINKTVEVADDIVAKPIVALKKDYNGAPQPLGVIENVDTSGTGLANVPITSLNDVTYAANQTVNYFQQAATRNLVTGNFQPINDLMVIKRVALLMNVNGKK